jgi:hypothetical protein
MDASVKKLSTKKWASFWRLGSLYADLCSLAWRRREREMVWFYVFFGHVLKQYRPNAILRHDTAQMGIEIAVPQLPRNVPMLQGDRLQRPGHLARAIDSIKREPISS